MPRRRPIDSTSAAILTTGSGGPANRPLATISAGAAVFLATILAYLPVTRCGFVWDDDFYVTENKTLAEPGGLAKIWFRIGATPQYYPLVFTSFWIERRIWGDWPLGYHLVNVVLHASSAVILWRVLRRLAVPGAWLAATVFALHPVNVESVAWITERKNVLSGVFYMLALRACLRFAEAEGGPRWARYATAVFFFVCALLSKTVTASLPAVVLVLLWWRGRLLRRHVAALVPMLLLGAAMGWHTAYLEEEHVGAKGEEWALTAAERCQIAGRAIWFYAAKLIWPSGLTFVYPRWKTDPSSTVLYLYPLSVVLLIIAAWIARRWIGRGPLAAILCFCGTLFPALGFLNVYPFRYSFVADHFQYLASVALITLFVASAAHLLRGQPKALAAVASASLLVLLGSLTARQTRIYENMETLWTDTLRKNPGAWMAHGNLGDDLSAKGRYAEAIDHYRKTLEMKKDSAITHFNLGLALMESGQIEAAISSYKDALRFQPHYPQAHVNLGCAYLDREQVEAAIEHLTTAIRQDPELAAAHYNLANAFSRKGRPAEAESAYRESLRLKPDYVEAWVNLAGVLLAADRMEEAIEAYRRALSIRPDSFEARANLGSILAERGQLPEALTHLSQAVRLNARSIEPRYRYALALAASGKRELARQQFREVLRMKPDHAGAKEELMKLETSGAERRSAP